MADFDAIFKAYDIRGTVPDQIDAGAAPVGADIRLGEIEAMVRADPDPAPVSATGRRTRRDMLAECMAQVRSFVDTTALRPLQVVVDTANGISGLMASAVRCSLRWVCR